MAAPGDAIAGNVVLYFVPLAPLIPRAWLMWRFRAYMLEPLGAAERASTEHRALTLPLAGFSFTAALGLPAFAIASSSKVNIQLAVYCSLLAFLCYMASVQVQPHKFNRWRDQIGSGFFDVATTSLILAAIAMIAMAELPVWYFVSMTTLAIFVSMVDLFLRFSAWHSFFSAKEATHE